jgi:AGCS family alanine or glycine:cation symporter
MYYIEQGLGSGWRWMAIFFAIALGFTAFITGNAVQANTLADTMQSNFGTPNVVTGLLAAAVVAVVILGGITRIGRVTAVLAPLMAGIYVLSALLIILMNIGEVLPTFGLIMREAFNPTAGVAGTGIGILLVTLNWGVNRGLFSNEAGQGSAPIAHAAAKTDEPVSEGVVGLVEPFIDTIVIVTMTCLVLIITGVYDDRVPSEMTLSGGDLTYVATRPDGSLVEGEPPTTIPVTDGRQALTDGQAAFAWHDLPVERFFTDLAQTQPFTGAIEPAAGLATGADGTTYDLLYGDAPEGGAPLTQLGFQRGLAPLGDWGGFIVVLSVILFAISTAISWSYYGDRCAAYLFGKKAVFPYRLVYVGMVFLGTVIAPAAVWDLGDIALTVCILPNLLALVLLSTKTRNLMDDYFDRQAWRRQPRT